MPKAPKATTVPERQAAQMPEKDASTRSTDDARRRRGFSSLIVAGNTASLGAPSTTTSVLGA
ncbi:hypothetical protein [Sphingobium sp. CAP-1]|uniref:hypothetical protein n=1 Tax=Sphingobium sp. CAP-1 TaxID=2676077 RepID=UPI0012BB21CD|nr:hypothetical protein [Sphingobium sp. CAP-1]QGP80012.1 hypothetical protein GL174_14225 [Sphingobium sp. CAP-1]